jgi:hypothetical protein
MGCSFVLLYLFSHFWGFEEFPALFRRDLECPSNEYRDVRRHNQATSADQSSYHQQWCFVIHAYFRMRLLCPTQDHLGTHNAEYSDDEK